MSTSCVVFSYPKLLSISVLTFIKWRLNTELLTNTLRNVVFSFRKADHRYRKLINYALTWARSTLFIYLFLCQWHGYWGKFLWKLRRKAICEPIVSKRRRINNFCIRNIFSSMKTTCLNRFSRYFHDNHWKHAWRHPMGTNCFIATTSYFRSEFFAGLKNN